MVVLYYCDRLDRRTGEPCTEFSKRKYNIDRHIERKHAENSSNGDFIQYVVDGSGGLAKHAPSGHSFKVNASAPITTPATAPSTSSPITLTNTSILPSIIPEILGLQSAVNHPSPNLEKPHSDGAIPASVSLPQSPSVDLTSEEPSPPRNELKTSCEKGKERKDRARKRLYDSIEKENTPKCDVKRSKRWPGQQKGIGWITQAGKQAFDEYLSELLARWGVKRTHQGSCVLCPAEIAAIDPSTLSATINAENCPLAWADPMTYQYEDHTTSLTRAIA